MGMAVQLAAVSKRFKRPDGSEHCVLNGIDLSCPAGETIILEGLSGSGKSTLLNLIAGLFLPDEGRVHIGTERIDQLSETRRDRFRAENIGYVFQTFNLLSPLTALENLVVPARLTGRETNQIGPRAEEILTELGLREHLDKRPYELSVGQRQRVAVARAVLNRPQLLLADEPTANLDAHSAAAVVTAMVALRQRGTTLVIATHDQTAKKTLGGSTFNLQEEAAES